MPTAPPAAPAEPAAPLPLCGLNGCVPSAKPGDSALCCSKSSGPSPSPGDGARAAAAAEAAAEGVEAGAKGSSTDDDTSAGITEIAQYKVRECRGACDAGGFSSLMAREAEAGDTADAAPAAVLRAANTHRRRTDEGTDLQETEDGV